MKRKPEKNRKILKDFCTKLIHGDFKGQYTPKQLYNIAYYIPENVRYLIENFILYYTTASDDVHDENYETVYSHSLEDLHACVDDYIAEDHVDGYGRETELCIDLWLKAEEKLRKGKDKKCLKLKEEYQENYKYLDKKERKYVDEYLNQIGA